MKLTIVALLLLLCTCVRAQSTVQSETEDGTHYTYTLTTDAVDKADLVQAFARASGVTVHPRFSGDWTTSDDAGIEYSLNTRQHLLSVRYRGDDPETMTLARQKAETIRDDLRIPEDAPARPAPSRIDKI